MSVPDPGAAARLAHEVQETARSLGVPVSHDPALLGSIGPLAALPALPGGAFDAIAGVLAFLAEVDEAAAAEADAGVTDQSQQP